MPAPVRYDFGKLNELIIERVGGRFMKVDAAIKGGSKEIVVFPQNGVLAQNLRDRLGELGPEEVIEVIVMRGFGMFSRRQRAYLAVQDGRLYLSDSADASDSSEVQEFNDQAKGGAVPVEASLQPEVLPAVYGGGLPGYEGNRSEWDQGFVRKEVWWVGLSSDQVRLWRQGASQRKPGDLIRDYDWEQIDSVTFEAGGTRSNLVALMSFGVLGLGARKDLSVVAIASAEETAVFVIHKALHQLRPLRDSLVRLGVPEAKVPFGSNDPGKGDKSPNDLANRLSQLAELFQQGLITEEEYATVKAKLLDEA